MSMSNAFEGALLDLIFLNINIANIGDATGLRGSAVPGNLWVGLCSADPGEAGDQTTNEMAYTGYARVPAARGAGGWTRTGNVINPTANIDFPQCTALPGTYAFWTIGTAPSGAGMILYKGVIGSNLGGFTALASDAITIPGLTGVAVNDNIAFFAGPGDTLPAGVTEGTVYFVKTVAGNDITISATAGGATIDITGPGKGRAMKVTPQVMQVGTIPRIPTASQLVVD